MATTESSLPVAERIAALRRSVSHASSYLPEDSLAHAQEVAVRAEERLRHGTHHTVIALAGPTGAGKSTLFNALVGEAVSAPGVLRPTTSVAHAVIFGEDDGAGSLLDWLSIKHRHHVPADRGAPGLILVDLPDYDSTTDTNRMEVDRLIELVDLVVWVTDPQKYADHALHAGYLQPLQSHAEVMRFVLSKVDTLSSSERDACLADFAELLRRDGLPDSTPVPVSLQPGTPADGLDEVRAVLHDVIEEQRSVVQRLEADIATAAEHLIDLHGANPEALASVIDAKPIQRELVNGLSRAGGVDAAARTVADQHMHEARLAVGWPATTWVNRFRKRPVASLPVARKSAVADAEVGLALRALADAVTGEASGPWSSGIRRRTQELHQPVLVSLDTVSGRVVAASRTKPRWWTVVTSLQRMLALVGLAGLAWLVALALIDGFFRVDLDLTVPALGDLPLPTAMVLISVVGGLALSVVGRALARVGANRRARRVRADLETEIETLAEAEILAPLRSLARFSDASLTDANLARGA